MRRQYRKLFPGLGVIAMLGVLVTGVAQTTHAQACTPVAPATSCVTTMTPSAISNAVNTSVTINGAGFTTAAPPIVRINQGAYTALLNVTNIASGQITAVVAAGLPAEINGTVYTISVADSGANAATGSPLQLIIMTPAPTAAPTATVTPTMFARPLVTVLAYGASSTVIYPGQDIDFDITVQNTGQNTARDVTIAFTGNDLIPRDTGGLRSLGDITAGSTAHFIQPLRVASNLSGYEAVVDIKIRYFDDYGKEYSDTSTLSLEAGQYASTLTPTPTLSILPNLIIDSQTVNPAQLVPGTSATLSINLRNVSGAGARQVVIRLNVPTASADILAVMSSNERYIEQIGAGATAAASYDIAVLGDAAAGIVPVEFEMTYTDDYNIQHTETESLSVRVDVPPVLYISLFDTIPETITVGDSFELPIQVINIGTQAVNVNTVEVTSDKLVITNGQTYMGELDSGTSGSLVANAEADEAGTAIVTIAVNYLDAFQQVQTYTSEMTFTVKDVSAPENTGPGGAGFPEMSSEDMTVWERIKQALLGFFGIAVRDRGMGGLPMGGTLPGSGAGTSTATE